LLAQFETALTASPGGNNNPEGLGGKSHKTSEAIVNHDNVMIDNPPPSPPPRPTLPPPERGNSASYSARRLARDAPIVILDNASRL